MAKDDYYEILGISSHASTVEIKSAYRKSALKYHPDRNPGNKEAEEKFKITSEAYEVLADPQKKAAYDQFGHAGLGGVNHQGFDNVNDIFSSFGDIFEEFFGGSGRTREQGHRGRDLVYELKVSFKEAVFGSSKEIEYDRMVVCKTCHGNKAKPGTKKNTCPSCHGHGQIRRSQGFFSIATTCSQCQGSGHIVKEFCPTCHGKAYEMEHKKIHVKVPAGIDSGMRLRVAGEGEGGAGGHRHGDLYVNIEVGSSKIYKREDHDIFYMQEISMVHAALGCKIKVQTLEKEHVLDIRAGTQHGDRLKLSGLGIPHLKGLGRGDFIVELAIRIPKKLKKEQRELLEQFAKIPSNEESTSPIGGFFHKLFGD